MKDGGLPEDIGSLSSLKELRLSRNNFENLPRSIAQLGALRILDVSHCPNLKEFPQVNDGLCSLEELDLSYCNLRDGGLPEDIGSLSSLKELRLSRNNFENLPRSIAQLGALQILDVSHCPNLKEFPQVNDGLRSLEELDLSYCNLIDRGLPEDMGSLSSLKELRLSQNNFEHLPRSIAQLAAIRSLHLSGCKRLKELPSFMGMPNLKYLNLGNCNDLEEVPCVNVESLKFLNLRDCSSLEKFPEVRGIMKLELEIEMEDSGIRELPSSYFQSTSYFQSKANFTMINFSFMKHLVALPSSIGMLKSLKELDVSYFSSLKILPEEIGDLENLEKLDARCTLISRPPSSIVHLNKLKSLSFKKEESEVGLQDGVCFAFPSVNDGLRSLERLYLSYCNLKDGGLPEDIGSLSSLKELYLNGNNFENLPRSIAKLAALQSLDLSDCKRLKELPGFMEMPNLEYLNLGNCDYLEEVDDSLGYCGKLIRLHLGYCTNLKRFPCVNVESLEFLNLRDCPSLEKFPEIRGRMKPELKIKIKDSGIRELPSSYFQSETHLTKIDLRFMKHLVALPSSIGMLKSLVELDVSDCSSLEILPEEIGHLENLEKLNASCTLISRPPSSIVHLNKLKSLSFKKAESKVGLQDGVYFVFPSVNDGLRSLERLYLSYCNLKDGGLPEDIGSLSSLKELYLNGNNFEHLPRSIAQLAALQSLDLSDCKRLKELPGFMEMPNLEYLNLGNCDYLEEVDDSLGYCGKLIRLHLGYCTNLKRFPCVNVESLEFLNLRDCPSLEKFPEIRGRMKPELKIKMKDSGIRELPSSYFQSGTHLTKLDLSFMEHLVALPSSIGMLKSLKELDVSYFSSLKILPEKIGDLENLEKLDASCTLISRPPSSIVHLNKLKSLSFKKEESEVGLQDGVCFVFPSVNDGLRSLERLYLSYCNLKDGGLPEDIGSLSSLKELYLNGNNFEHLPRSIAQLAALQSLDLSDCKRLKELPEFPQQLDTIYADWSNDWICNSLFQNISSLQHISASDSLSLRVFTSEGENWYVPSWFHHQGMDTSVSVNLPENWYVPNNFLGFAICYTGILDETTAQLIPLCDDGMSMSYKIALSDHSECDIDFPIQFFLVPLSSLWDISKANGKTPNDYRRIRLSFSGETDDFGDFGLRLLYKHEPSEASDKGRVDMTIVTRKSRYDDSEASSSSSERQRSHSDTCGNSVFENLQQQVEAPVCLETLQLFPTSPGI